MLPRFARRCLSSSSGSPRPPVVFLIAGEPSGDIIGARLMRALRKQVSSLWLDPNPATRLTPSCTHQYPGPLRFEGVGGEAMQSEGLSSLFPMAELTVAGFAEVRLLELKKTAARLLVPLSAMVTDVNCTLCVCRWCR